MDKIKLIFITIFTTINTFLGLLALPIYLLLISNVIDYVTGIGASKKQGIKINSNTSFWGIVKKLINYVLIIVGVIIDLLINYMLDLFNMDFNIPFMVSVIVALWLLISELMSITENCEIMGVKVPILSPILKYLNKKLEEKSYIKDGE